MTNSNNKTIESEDFFMNMDIYKLVSKFYFENDWYFVCKYFYNNTIINLTVFKKLIVSF